MDSLKVWEEYRAGLFCEANKKIDHMYRSPIMGSHLFSSKNDPIVYSYERNIDCKFLEERARNLRVENEKWISEHIIYSSGMAAITSLLQNFIHMIIGGSTEVRIAVFGAYYETRMVMDYLSIGKIVWKNCDTVADMEAALDENYDIYMIEPVRYDWELDAFDIPRFISHMENAWRDNKKCRLVIFDSTLIAEELPLGALLERIPNVPYLVLANTNSLLKLHQQGLELTNAGIVSLYVSQNNSKAIDAVKMASFFRKIRTITDKGLQLRGITLLDNDFSFDRDKVREYSQKVFINNAMLALSAETGGVFEKISHPVFDSNNYSWAKAPFVVFQLKENCISNYEKLLEIINYEAEQRNLPLYYGSRFGFRHCRFECIIPELNKMVPIFKVAMGWISDERRDKIIELLIEISKYKSFSDLAKQYEDKDVKKISLEDLE